MHMARVDAGSRSMQEAEACETHSPRVSWPCRVELPLRLHRQSLGTDTVHFTALWCADADSAIVREVGEGVNLRDGSGREVFSSREDGSRPQWRSQDNARKGCLVKAASPTNIQRPCAASGSTLDAGQSRCCSRSNVIHIRRCSRHELPPP